VKKQVLRLVSFFRLADRTVARPGDGMSANEAAADYTVPDVARLPATNVSSVQRNAD